MHSDPEEHSPITDATKRTAREARASAKRWAKAQASRAEARAVTGETGEEAVKQRGLIFGGLIGIAVIMVQPFLAARSLDVSARICVIAFSAAIPLLAALVMVNRQEAFRRRRAPSRSVTITQVIAQLAAFVGIVAGFWHIYWVAGVVFLAAGLVATFVHSAGYMRLEGYPDDAKRFIEEAERTAEDGTGS
jgi:cation transport ATPase